MFKHILYFMLVLSVGVVSGIFAANLKQQKKASYAVYIRYFLFVVFFLSFSTLIGNIEKVWLIDKAFTSLSFLTAFFIFAFIVYFKVLKKSN